jgi:hypothetical protein
MPLTGNRWGKRWLSYSGRTPTFGVFFVISVAVREKSCDACGDGKYYFRLSFPALQGDGVSDASIAVDRISTGHTLGELKRKDADFLCTSCI